MISHLRFICPSLLRKAELLEEKDNLHIPNKFLAYSRHSVNAQWKSERNNVKPKVRPNHGPALSFAANMFPFLSKLDGNRGGEGGRVMSRLSQETQV